MTLSHRARPLSFALALSLAACGGADEGAPGGETDAAPAASAESAPLPTVDDRLFAIEGLAGPEAVKYDPDQDVYFISNFGDGGEERANDGFLSRVQAEDGTVVSLRWATGTDEVPLIDPRGMALDGDLLWVADADGVHAFDRRSGEHRQFVNMTALEPGFLNDLAVGPDGALYVTDTGTSKVYRLAPGGEPEVAAEGPDVGNPNGITWDPATERFVLVPWEGGGDRLRSWNPATGELGTHATSPGARFDGVEPMPGSGGGLLVASQADSALHLVQGGVGRPVIRVPGRPADIAIDTRRGRVAVPYIALDRVDVWALPPAEPQRD